jgi:hypothetical protein
METKREAHHMWEAEREDGKLRVKRTKYQDEDEVLASKKARREASRKIVAEESALACLGIWAATLVDDDLFTREIPKPIVARFNVVRDIEAPKVYSWQELDRAVGVEKLAKVRKIIANGMKTRLISKDLGVPFLVAAEVIDRLDGMDKDLVKKAVEDVKRGDLRVANKKYGSIIKDVGEAFAKFAGKKLAVDDKAKRYFEDYFGPYGQELVSEIQRRVRADLAYKWLRKNGVDEAAAEYWKNYFSEGGYGEALVSEIPKKLSPAK